MEPLQDRRVEQARASLLARIEELGRRLDDARERFDIRARIAAHPMAAVGIAFAVGALLALPKKRVPLATTSEETKVGMMSALVAALGSMAFGVVKSAAIHHLADAVRRYWNERTGVASPESFEH